MAYAFLNGIFGGKGGDDSTLRSLIDRSIEEIEIPEGVTKIGEYCFLKCSNLKKITIPNTVTHIEGYALGINALTTLELPDSLIELGTNTIYNCSQLKSITFGKNLSTIKDNNFNVLPKCVLYDFSKCEQVPRLTGVCFKNINAEAKILVPASLYDEWVAATNWSAYADYIEAVEGELFGIIEPTKEYEKACSIGQSNIKGMDFSTWKIDLNDTGYFIYGYPLRPGQVRLEISGGEIISSFTARVAAPNILFVTGYNSENGGVCVVDADEITVSPESWKWGEPPEKVTVEVPPGLGIDGVYFSITEDPIITSIDPGAE